MKTVFNTVTQKNEIQFNGVLISLNRETSLENSKGTKYFLGEVEFKNAAGKVTRASCSVYENNLNKGMETGISYLCVAQKADNGNVYIHMSHLTGASLASVSDFGSLFGEAPQAVQSTSGEQVRIPAEEIPA